MKNLDETCFAAKGDICIALDNKKVKVCRGKECSFYKTEEQRQATEKYARERCARLGVAYNKAEG